MKSTNIFNMDIKFTCFKENVRDLQNQAANMKLLSFSTRDSYKVYKRYTFRLEMDKYRNYIKNYF